MIDEAAASELDALRVKFKSVVEENNSLSVKVVSSHTQLQIKLCEISNCCILKFNRTLFCYFCLQVQKFEKDRHDYDANLSKLKETVASQKQEIVDLIAQVIIFIFSKISI